MQEISTDRSNEHIKNKEKLGFRGDTGKWEQGGSRTGVHAEDVADSVLLSLDGEGCRIDDLRVPFIRNPVFFFPKLKGKKRMRKWKKWKKEKRRIEDWENR